MIYIQWLKTIVLVAAVLMLVSVTEQTDAQSRGGKSSSRSGPSASGSGKQDGRQGSQGDRSDRRDDAQGDRSDRRDDAQGDRSDRRDDAQGDRDDRRDDAWDDQEDRRKARGVARHTTRRIVRRSTTYIATLPTGCTTVVIEETTLHHCGATYYQPSGTQYVVVYVE